MDYVSKHIVVKKGKGKRPGSRAGAGSGAGAGSARSTPTKGSGAGKPKLRPTTAAADDERASELDLALASIQAACTHASDGDIESVLLAATGCVLRQVQVLFPGWHAYIGLLQPRGEHIKFVLACCAPHHLAANF